jgi:hypothetical protein
VDGEEDKRILDEGVGERLLFTPPALPLSPKAPPPEPPPPPSPTSVPVRPVPLTRSLAHRPPFHHLLLRLQLLLLRRRHGLREEGLGEGKSRGW